MSTFARMSRSEIIHGRIAMLIIIVLLIAKSYF
ncbi:chlorophyll a/b-binding protein [Prochlorococcus sp. MIT 0603]